MTAPIRTPAQPTTATSGFVLDAVRFEAGGTSILHPVSAEIGGGQVLGLVGPNGSGKSTLLRILARQTPPSGGRVAFGGRNLADWGARDLARHIAYLPQYPQTGIGLTAREVIALGRYPWHGPFGRFTADDAARTDEAMRVTETTEFANRTLDTLSGGERQRVWLAMLVAQDARCLLLDEPTSALDIGHQIEVLALIRRLAHEGGRTVVIVMHDVNMASRFCDRVMALRGGRLVVDESIDRFMTPESLRMVYGLDMQVLPHATHPAGVAIPN